MKATVFTLGCKVNQYESQSLINVLSKDGYFVSDRLEFADLYVINTCSVTAEADKKSRQTVARALKFNPAANVIILGCSGQNDPKPYLNKPNVISVGGTGGKIDALKKALSPLKNHKDLREELPKIYEDNLSPFQNKTRGLVKIQDGCDRFCSYCIVPHLRGRSRSRPPLSVLAEAESLTGDTGEIVLTGIDISSYGKDIGCNLTQLIELLKVKGRKRLGSLECGIIDEELLQAMKQNDFCDHFHISLQSGCDTVLKRMNRHYSTAEYLKKIELIRKFFPYAGITTDVIAGFCLETEDEHLQTAEFLQKAGFSDVHIFPYSPRIGTNAYKMPDLAFEIKKRRVTQLLEIKNNLKREFLQKNLGRTLKVYVEEKQDGCNFGFTSNYIKVYTDAEPLSLHPHVLKELYKDGIKGEKS